MNQSRHPRQSLPVLMIAAPVVIAAAWLAWFELRLNPPLSNPAPGSSFARAVAENSIVEAFAHIRSGGDPNAPVAFRDNQLTGGDELLVTPLLIAVAYNRADSVRMLMSSGAELDGPGNRFALCLAHRMGHADVSQIILKEGGARETCPDPEGPHAKVASLRAYVE